MKVKNRGNVAAAAVSTLGRSGTVMWGASAHLRSRMDLSRIRTAGTRKKMNYTCAG